MMRRLLALAIAGAAGTALVRSILVPWMRRWGRRPGDDGPLPGDEVVADPTAIETRGIDIAAPPEAVWPWLVQMGFGRAGWYSYDAIDMRGASADRLLPEHRELRPGDIVPTHPGGGFVVRDMEPERHLVLYLDAELVREQAEQAKAINAESPANLRMTGAFMETGQPTDFTATWAFVLEPLGPNRTRLIERFRIRFGSDEGKPWTKATLPLMGFGVFLMMRKQMLGIRDRAERGRYDHLVAA